MENENNMYTLYAKGIIWVLSVIFASKLDFYIQTSKVPIFCNCTFMLLNTANESWFLEGCQNIILWNFEGVMRIMNWNLCSSFFLWAYCVHWMHYKDEKHHTEYFYESHPCKRAPSQTVNYKRSMSCSPHYNPK